MILRVLSTYVKLSDTYIYVGVVFGAFVGSFILNCAM